MKNYYNDILIALTQDESLEFASQLRRINMLLKHVCEN